MLSHEDDPHDEVLVPVDQGGRIHLYGVTFEPHEVKVVDDENPIKGTEEERYEGIQDEGKEKGITRNMMVDVKKNIDINEYHTNKTVDKIHETVEVIDFAEISKIEVLDYSPIVRKSPIKKKLINKFFRELSERTCSAGRTCSAVEATMKCSSYIYGTNLFYASVGLDEWGKFLDFKHKVSMENVQKLPRSVHICNIYI